MKDIKIVNINDIEDLILAKHEIDVLRIEHEELTERSILQEFINSYASPKYIYMINDIQIPFNYIKVYDNDYLFVTEYNKENIEIITNKIKRLKYNMNNLIKLTTSDLINLIDINNVIIYNGQYYN